MNINGGQPKELTCGKQGGLGLPPSRIFNETNVSLPGATRQAPSLIPKATKRFSGCRRGTKMVSEADRSQLINSFPRCESFAKHPIRHRNKVIVYDLRTDVRYTLTPEWDRSPESLAVSLISYVFMIRRYRMLMLTSIPPQPVFAKR